MLSRRKYNTLNLVLNYRFTEEVVEYKKDPEFITLEQVQQARDNKDSWVKIVSTFISGIIYRFATVEAENKNVSDYCPAGGEALLFLVLENNIERWIAEIKMMETEEDNAGAANSQQLVPEPVFSSKKTGNGKTFGWWSAAGIEQYNENMRAIAFVNKNETKMARYNTALRQACKERKEAKGKPRKRRRSTEDVRELIRATVNTCY